MTPHPELETWWERAGLYDAFDRSFAETLARLTGHDDPPALLGAALACHAPRRGHACLDVTRPWLAADAEEDLPWPDPDAWRRDLRAAPFVRESHEGATPLVLDGPRLYLERYYFDELFLANEVAARIPAGLDPPGHAADPVERAASLALRSGLVLVSGGPGTGKTTAAARILAALALNGRDPERFALLAPTGKAAARLAEAVREGLSTLSLPDDLLARFPREGRTLHRALGLNPDHPFAPPRPRDDTAVVVDEASMMDLVVAARLFQAVPRACPVLLLGDPHQLASVEAGAVFADLCEAPSLAGACVHLRRTWRFGGAIADLAEAVVSGDEARVRDLVAGAAGEVQGVDPDRVPDWRGHLRDLTTQGLARFVAAVTAGDAVAALEALRGFRLLCAVRRGPFGCEALAALANDWLWGRAPDEWFAGRTVLITQNDPDIGLFNGDTGVAVEGPEGLRVFFEGREPGSVRSFAPARLPPHEDALATTVHKAQGAQFDRVAVVLPPVPSPVLTRELLYTAVTRARFALTLVARPDLAALAARRPTLRASGLRDRLERRGS